MGISWMLVYINGRFLTQPVTGVQRFALELLHALDEYLTEHASLRQEYKFICLVPANCQDESLPHWKNIAIERPGNLNGNLWEQIELPLFARKGLLLSLCNTGPVLHFNQIVVFHDASVFAVPQAYTIPFVIKYRLIMGILARTARQILTVSQFSRLELAKYLRIGSEKISLIPEGCEHILQLDPDYSIIEKYGLEQKPFILILGSASLHKNVAGVVKAIRRFPGVEISLVVAGGEYSRVFKPVEGIEAEHIIRLGYVNDSELRALYEHALCLVFPSFYEGFGLPPLEAMSCGCLVISSNQACLPEIYRDAALYFDPTSEEEIQKSIKEVMANPALRELFREKGFSLVKQYTWKVAVESLLNTILNPHG
jgi:glycosyltransferase involved in cell wall biosynthesis